MVAEEAGARGRPSKAAVWPGEGDGDMKRAHVDRGRAGALHGSDHQQATEWGAAFLTELLAASLLDSTPAPAP